MTSTTLAIDLLNQIPVSLLITFFITCAGLIIAGMIMKLILYLKKHNVTFKSCVRLEHDKLLIPLLQKRKSWGDVLDVGSKDSRYKQYMKYDSFTSLDIEKGCDIQADITRFVPPTKYDIITCFQVLEHVKRPFDALINMRECLKRDGRIIVTVPFYHPIHSKQDFWRWTQQGIKYLMKDAGFRNIKITPYGNNVTVTWQNLNQRNLLPNQLARLLLAGRTEYDKTHHGYLCEATK